MKKYYRPHKYYQMQGKAEPPIKQTYFCQVVPSRYILSESLDEFSYTPTQRIFANTVSLNNLAIYNQFPNIDQFYNSFQISVNGSIYVVQIPSTNYNFWDIQDLQTIIQTQLNAQVPFGVWSVGLGGNNNRFTVITNNTFTFKLVYFAQYQFAQVLRYLGFSSPNDPAFNIPALSQLSLYPYAVQRTQNLSVQLKNTANLFSDTIGVICQIPLNASIGNGIFWESPYYQFSRHIISLKDPYPIYSFSLQFLDDNGLVMSLAGQRVSATVSFEEFQKL